MKKMTKFQLKEELEQTIRFANYKLANGKTLSFREKRLSKLNSKLTTDSAVSFILNRSLIKRCKYLSFKQLCCSIFLAV